MTKPALLAELEAARARLLDERGYEAFDTLGLLNLEATMMALQAVGECRLGDDYAEVYAVLDADGLRWVCTHDPPHRSKVVAELDR